MLNLEVIADRIGSSYWFFPGLFLVGGIALAYGAVLFDLYGPEIVAMQLFWPQLTEPSAARMFLSTVASSTITVAGVAFSITIAAFANATTHYGPRLIANFMRDRGNQISLGIFIATFVYCLIVLNVVRGDTDGYDPFVPDAAMAGSMILVSLSTCTLIYYFHHIPEMLNVSQMIASIGRSLHASIDTLYPDEIGDEVEDREKGGALFEDDDAQPGFFEIGSTVAGYVQHVDGDQLLTVADDRACFIKLKLRPGDFVHEGECLALYRPADVRHQDIGDEVKDLIRASVVIDVQRSPMQDLQFLFDQLTEVAIRALSPGVNDPTTAINCIHWIDSGLRKLVTRDFPPSLRQTENGDPRLLLPARDFNEMLDETCRKIMPFAATNGETARALLEMLAVVGKLGRSRNRKSCVAANIRVFFRLLSDELGPRTSEEVREFVVTRLANAELSGTFELPNVQTLPHEGAGA